jgi:filamentous hemagglutinin family protein
VARRERCFYLLFAITTAGAAAFLGPGFGRAEVTTDGSLGAKVRLTGKEVTVPARLGQVHGKNLFHSFERFGIAAGKKVTSTGPNGLKNVIGRVTGGERSTINGTLASTVNGADLWLLNPAGILFGPKARLEVPGSFHASTADELRFADGAVFSALDPGGSVLSVAAPEAFGFLGVKPGEIAVHQSRLAVPKGKALSLAGGRITIRGSDENDPGREGLGNEPGTVRVPAGRATLAALGGPGAVVPGTGRATGAVTGTIRLTRKATVVTSGNGGGSIRIRGGRLVAEDNSYIFADNSGSSDAAGGATVAVGKLELASGSVLSAESTGVGSGGTVQVQADRLLLAGGSAIVSRALGETPRAGAAGAVRVTATTLRLLDGTIRSDSERSGDAGTVMVNAGILELDGGGQIRSNGRGSGDAGTVTVNAGILKLGDGQITSVAQGSGPAGTITIKGGILELGDNGTISSDALSSAAGTVTIVEARTLNLHGKAQIVSSAWGGVDDVGAVTINAGTVELRDAAQIVSLNNGVGAGGRVNVHADRALVVRGGKVETNSYSRGPAGDVEMWAPRLVVRDGGEISSSGLGHGRELGARNVG